MLATATSEPAATPDGKALRLLGETLPQVIDAAIAAARSHDRGEISLLEVMLHESRLRSLIAEVVAAHAEVAAPTGFRNHELEILETDRDGICIAHAPMAFCPESALIVHAPIMLGRLCALASRALGPDEVPVGMRSVRFHKPVRHDLELLLALDGRASLPERQWQPALEGLLVTDRGRECRFRGHALTRRPVAGWIDNAVLAETFALTRPSDGRAALLASVTPAPGSLVPRYVGSPADAVQLLLETLIRAVVVTRNVDGRGLLLGGIESISWPADLATRIRRGIRILVDPRPSSEASPGKRWRRLPVGYREDAAPAQILAELRLVEGRVTLGSIFA